MRITSMVGMGLWLASVAGAAEQPALIPWPAHVAAQPGTFAIGPRTRIVVMGDDRAAAGVAEYLAELLRHPTGFRLEVKHASRPSDGAITLRLDAAVAGDEAYRLTVRPKRVEIAARTPQGLFYGVQTLRQLLPVEIESASPVSGVAWNAPGIDVEDAPRFPYRGMHLDVSRHFFPVEFIKRYIDILAAYKLNTFHWHLTDDQGWRIEIKKYPRLTEVGARRKDTQTGFGDDGLPTFEGKPYEGFYTQEQIRDVVRYAQERFVTVLPEIEMPGHSTAALAAYPELACTAGPFEVATKFGVFDDVYCPTDRTFAFLQDVLTEVMDLFPSRYIHVGGDEVPKVRWKESAATQEIMRREGFKQEEELQGYFMRKIGAFLEAHGRKLVGWDEMLEGGLAPGVVVMSWRGFDGGRKAAAQGHDVIMTPQLLTYFDLHQGDEDARVGGGDLPLEKVYTFDPIPADMSGDDARHVLGAQADLWTEWIATPPQAERMLLPRLSALAETIWSPKGPREWTSFARRLQPHLQRFDVQKLDYSRQFYRVRQQKEIDGQGRFWVKLLGNTDDPIFYTRQLASAPAGAAESRPAKYDGPIQLTEPTTVSAVAMRDGQPLAPASTRLYAVNLATGHAVQYTHPYSPKYPGAGEHALTTGLRGGTSYTDNWQGFDGVDLEATVDLGSAQPVRRIETAFLRHVPSWIMLPRSVELSVSTDGKDFQSVYKEDVKADDRPPVPLIYRVTGRFEPRPARYVRVHATNYGPLPAWHPGAGNRPWIFVDQIVVQ